MKTLTLLLFSLFSPPLMLDAQTADEMLHKVTAAIETGQYGQAVSYFRQAISLDMGRPEMSYRMSIDKSSGTSSKLFSELTLAHKKNRNYDKAFLFYKELSQRDSDSVDYLKAVAGMQVCRGQEKDALRMCENVLELDADNLAANILLGNYHCLMVKQERKKPESDYRKPSSPTGVQYVRYRDGLSKLFIIGYEEVRSFLQRVVLWSPSAETRKTLDKILRIEKEMNR